MTVKQLMDLLDTLPENDEVVVTEQESSPFNYQILGVVEGSRLDRGDQKRVLLDPEYDEPDKKAYVVCGEQQGRGRKLAWEECEEA